MQSQVRKQHGTWKMWLPSSFCSSLKTTQLCQFLRPPFLDYISKLRCTLLCSSLSLIKSIAYTSDMIMFPKHHIPPVSPLFKVMQDVIVICAIYNVVQKASCHFKPSCPLKNLSLVYSLSSYMILCLLCPIISHDFIWFCAGGCSFDQALLLLAIFVKNVPSPELLST